VDFQSWTFVEYQDKIGWQYNSATATAKAWAYVVGVRQGAKQYLFINGTCIDSSSQISAKSEPRVTGSDLTIGRSPGKPWASFTGPIGSNYFFYKGKIDEVCIASSDRSADWIGCAI